MKKIGFLFWFLICTSFAFGQQFLWSTKEDSDYIYVPLENVTSEVLEFYDYYEYYYDGSGYSKDGFLDYIEEFGGNSEDWKSFKDNIYEVEELTVNAFKGNLGRGSVVFIMIVSKKYVDFVYFSNDYESYAISTDSFDKEKFKKWFISLLIQGDPNVSVLEEVMGSGDIGGNLGGRGVLYKPVIRDKSQKSGDVNVKVCVDGSGQVISAEYTQNGSTTDDLDLKRTAIEGVKKYKFGSSSLDKQCGTIKIKFRVR